MDKIELLAPAGSYEAFIAAVQNGANAVYLGGNIFNARAFATNFSNEEITEAVKYAHLRNVRIYITVNTLFQDFQFNEVLEYLTFLYTAQVDALIIQDVGLVKIVKDHFPDFEIHMSTQASIHNSEGVKYFEELGIDRVVLSRENTIDEIEEICKNTSIDIEVFVHGALCVSYSGQCLMSSFIGKRSGNKGMCAQPCRLGYHLQKDNLYLNNKELYLLSPKDLCTIDSIDQLINAGITSFKIEGRMKRPEYVATIVSKYRHAIDHYLKNGQIENQDDAIQDMKKMFNRGFTKGYLLNDSNLMAKQYPGNRGINIGQTVRYNPSKKTVLIKLSDTLKQGDRIVFENNDFTRTITKLYKDGRLVNIGQKNDIVEIELDTKIIRDEKVYKVIDSSLLTVAQNSYRNEHYKIPVSIEFTGTINALATLQLKDGIRAITIHSTELVEQAFSSPLLESRIYQQLQKLGGTIYMVDSIDIDFDINGTISIKEINRMRREAVNILNTKRENIKIHHDYVVTNTSRIIATIPTKKTLGVRVWNIEQLKVVLQFPIDYCYFPIGDDLKQALLLAKKKRITIIPYTVFLTPTQEILHFMESPIFHQMDTILVGDYGALQMLKESKKCILDSSFNIYNSYVIDFFKDYDGMILSQEMSAKQMRNLNSSNSNIIFNAYGKNENMISKYCPISEHYYGKKIIGCNRCKEGKYALIDRKKEAFVIQMDEYCNMHLLNCHPLYIDQIEKLPVSSILLTFTDEDKKTIETIIMDYISNIMHNKKSQIKTNWKYTTGYFND